MPIIKNKNIFFSITGMLILASLVAIIGLGMNFGIDFKGGALMEVSYSERPDIDDLKEVVTELEIGSFSIRATGEHGYIIRTNALSEPDRTALEEVLSLGEAYNYEIARFTSIGPTIGQELRDKAFLAIGAVLLAIILYIAFAFRNVAIHEEGKKSHDVSSWKYGLIAIAALAHDIIIPFGAFVVYSHFTGAEIDVLFVMAILAILGYSVNDTIVVFDRVRENLLHNREFNIKEKFDETVGKSLMQTLARSINTSLTTLFVLGFLFAIGGVATQHFAFTLLIGVIAGSYSSIFLAAPLLVWVRERQELIDKK